MDAPANLPSFVNGELKTGQRLAVYSAPSSKSWRGASGKAVVSTNGAVYVSGRTDKWMLVMYEKNDGRMRVGYIEVSKIKGDLPTVPRLSLEGKKARIAVSCEMTDDPAYASEKMTKLSAGTEVTWLAVYGDWAYVETTISKKKARGFVSLDAIQP